MYGLDVEIWPKWTAPTCLSTWVGLLIAARALATYLIPGCVGRGVKLGSESSSGGRVWKSGNLETLEFGDLGIWRSGNLEIYKFGIQNMKKVEILKI